ncbi:hypothetical protein J6590_064144 [Homalodisca vitripennis]|nr:hypothetical protein J6590_064144 [Homalodisca vitripennis]
MTQRRATINRTLTTPPIGAGIPDWEQHHQPGGLVMKISFKENNTANDQLIIKSWSRVLAGSFLPICSSEHSHLLLTSISESVLTKRSPSATADAAIFSRSHELGATTVSGYDVTHRTILTQHAGPQVNRGVVNP